MNNNELHQLKQIVADAPETTVEVCFYDYGDSMSLECLNCERQFYDDNEKRWVDMDLVDNYFHSYRSISDIKTIIEQVEENEQLQAKINELEQKLKLANSVFTRSTGLKSIENIDHRDLFKLVD